MKNHDKLWCSLDSTYNGKWGNCGNEKTTKTLLISACIQREGVILNPIVSNSYYGMLQGQISMYLPPSHPIIAI